MNTDLSKDNVEVLDIRLNELDYPAYVQNEIKAMRESERKVQSAVNMANVAKDTASTAKSKSAGWGKKKVAIQTLQGAVKDLAEAVVGQADAQKAQFECQNRIVEVTKKLFALGVSNITANRIIVRELELRLKEASEDEISELERREINNVVEQLKARERIEVQLEKLISTSNQNSEDIKVLELDINRQIINLEENAGHLLDKELVYDEYIERETKEICLINEQLNYLGTIGKGHGKDLNKLKETQIKVERQINSLNDNFKRQSVELSTNKDMLEQQKEQIISHTKTLDNLDSMLNETKTILEKQNIKNKEVDQLFGSIKEQLQKIKADIINEKQASHDNASETDKKFSGIYEVLKHNYMFKDETDLKKHPSFNLKQMVIGSLSIGGVSLVTSIISILLLLN